MRTLAAAASASLLIACTGSNPSTAPSSNPAAPAAPTVLSVAVAGSAPLVGATTPFTATASLSDGTTATVTKTATWSTSNGSIASVNAAGVVTAIAAGDVDITAIYQTVAGRAHVTIAPPAPKTYTISGTLHDTTTGGPLAGVTVAAEDNAFVRYRAVSDPTGAYSILAFPPGRASLTVETDGYDPMTQVATVSSDTRIDFALQRRATPVNLSGTWTGSGSDGLGPGTFTWVLTQSGGSVSGSASMRPVSETDGSCASCHKVKDGSISGSVSASAISLRMSFALGGSQPTPTCLVVMDVSASGVTSSSVSGMYNGSDSCEPAVALGSITMTRR
jgi:Carboxypeptidase regulatory-like domain/Bacterial Ig-like domain (group 2)